MTAEPTPVARWDDMAELADAYDELQTAGHGVIECFIALGKPGVSTIPVNVTTAADPGGHVLYLDVSPHLLLDMLQAHAGTLLTKLCDAVEGTPTLAQWMEEKRRIAKSVLGPKQKDSPS